MTEEETRRAMKTLRHQQTKQGELMNSTTYVEEIELNVEEIEEVIAPALTTNHNETLVSDATK